MNANASNPQLTVADVVQFLRTARLSASDRVAVLRALHAGIPDLIPPDPTVENRIRTSRAVPPAFVHSAIEGISNSIVWQQAAATTPAELRRHLAFDENRALAEALRAMLVILDYNLRSHHWTAVELARTAYHAGKALGGFEGRIIRPYLELMSSYLPKDHRKTRKPRVRHAP